MERIRYSCNIERFFDESRIAGVIIDKQDFGMLSPNRGSGSQPAISAREKRLGRRLELVVFGLQ
ncbi:hypothetical protein [Natrinema sp. 1APR25-10V2]|uniref:hypothetical protein n=1 Tax=Natrinema sp. 1APR25-10V2 TaxID=2951081 RepID=UPI00287B8809|nr:hypothetical protein [Natrinema sp. 1APR25-10V2]